MRGRKKMSPPVPTMKAARLLGVSVSFLHHNRNLPGKLKAGRVLRWDLDELRAWMRRQAQEGGR